MKPKSMIGALMVALLFGCAAPRVGYDHAKGQGPPSIAVYRDGKEPTRPYRAIAEFVHRDGYGKEVNAVTEMVSRAKAVGADALILQPRQEETFVVGVEDYKFLWKGTAVVYQWDQTWCLPCAPANGGGPSRLQSARLVAAVAELGSLVSLHAMKILKVAGLFVGGLVVGTVVASWYWWHVMASQMSSESTKVAFRASEEAEWAAQLRLNETTNVIAQLEKAMRIGVVTLAEWEETSMLDEKSRIARNKWLVPVKVYHESYPVHGDEADRVNSLLAAVPDRKASSTCKSGICRLDDRRLATLTAATNSPWDLHVVKELHLLCRDEVELITQRTALINQLQAWHLTAGVGVITRTGGGDFKLEPLPWT